MISTDERSCPTPTFIESIRSTYDVEQEIDRILTRKMLTRSGPGYVAVPLQNLVKGIERLIRSEIGDKFAIANARWLQGGASKIQAAFELEWDGPDGTTPQVTSMVLRMDPPAGIVETSRMREFQVLQMIERHVPAPTAFWADSTGEYLPQPALICGFVTGVTKPSQRMANVSGVGTNFGSDELRAELGAQFVGHLAKIHTAVPAPDQLTAFDRPELNSSGIIRQINWWRRVWEEDRVEDLPLIDVAANWLISHAPRLDHVSLVHGDYRSGNFLFDEADARITALLDWELAVLGDRHQDLAWATSRYFGHYHEDGETFLASGMLPIEEFFDRYEQASGLPVDPERITYFRIFNEFCSTVHMLATARRVAKHSKTHQDIVVAWISMIGPIVLSQLRDHLEEVMS
ncbi:phosphotransferase family protein [Rhodococcus sp. T2V]|uniref:phosphotransferase family protein n=1 Tax=Rhodococcus sp. T2V TaxID=3034164 RepID=UPI0023E25F8F|nr:phosphotransferase family protein [Rhodococcus sp. T2V]MDF3313211.1 phosphotransferase family protein [Rhodococcus sp. T2V]